MKTLSWSLILIVIGLGLATACQAQRALEDTVRAPVAAGKFYSDSPTRLKLGIEKFLQDAVPVQAKSPVAIIVPHAGYIFSGQICADGFKQVSSQKYDVVVILGTNHTRPGFQKVSLYSGEGFRTPLGTAAIDREVVSALLNADPADCLPDKSLHEQEHSIEVVLPFIQVLFPQARIVPAVVGSPAVPLCTRFGQALAKVIKDKRALIVASSDLSHYPKAKDASVVDQETLEAMIPLDPALWQAALQARMKRRTAGLETCACGEAPIMAAMAAAKQLGAVRGLMVSYANSGDSSVTSDRSRVVGYGAVVLTRGEEELEGGRTGRLSPAPTTGVLRTSDKKALLHFARETISRLLLTDTVPLARGFSAHLQNPQGVFVTLKKRGELRGCIGRIIGDEPLSKLVGAMAVQSALNDRRFSPVTADELKDIDIEISVLTPMRAVSGAGEIMIGRDGVLLAKDGHSAVFLPQVASEQGWKREELLDQLCLKAGLDRGCWKQQAQLSIFQAVVFSESEFK
jgi:AmmeMemoRadiSam system protein B/AmmeMemoRadiSam system protein A